MAVRLTDQKPISSVGKRKAYTIYVDKRVWRSFTPIALRIFKNVSQALEAYMMSEVMKQEKVEQNERRR